MSNYSYVALDARGREVRGAIEVADQAEAIARIKEMGYFPTKVADATRPKPTPDGPSAPRGNSRKRRSWKSLAEVNIPFLGRKVKSRNLTVFTRQLATLIDAGLPLLRGLRLLEEQEANRNFRRIIGQLVSAIEGGSSFSEALAHHPNVFNRLYLNMVRAGEIGGVLETVLKRLAEFMEKAQKIKGKVVAAMFYPAAVMVVAISILSVLMVFVVPKFKEVFASLMQNRPLPAFTVLVLNIAETAKDHCLAGIGVIVLLVICFQGFIRLRWGRRLFDAFKLRMPILGPVVSKLAIARFTRTLGTLISSGVPILQALTIVKETAGNAIVADAVGRVHSSVKEGETITAPLRESRVFPPMVIGMVDVGEQTGALPDMLLKIADTYDEEVDNAVSAMTSLLEPIMIVLLAVIVGSIVIAMFLPIIYILDDGFGGQNGPMDQ